MVRPRSSTEQKRDRSSGAIPFANGFWHVFARYADDFVILVNSQKAGERVMASLRRFIESKLKLMVNEKKSRVVPSGESEFLGFTFARKKIRWTEKTLHKFKTRIRDLTKRNWGVSIEKRLKSLNHYLRGWIGYFRLTELYSNVESM